MKAIGVGILSVMGLVVTAVPSYGHHSFAAVFDRDDPVSLTGTVTKVEWMNPHTWFYIDVENADGAVEQWSLEMGAPNMLIRRGWRHDTLQVGPILTVVGFRARAKPLTGAVRSVSLATGERLFGAQDEAR